MVLIHNGNGGLRRIGPVDFLWKALSGVINWRLGAAVQLNDILNSFRAGGGTGTASLKVNLLHHMIEIRE